MELQEFKTAVEQMGRDFNEYKATAEKARTDGDVLLQQKMDALSADVLKKWETCQRHLDEMEAKAKRPNYASEGDEKVERKAAADFRNLLNARSNIKTDGPVEGDLEEYRAYKQAIGNYLRRGDPSLSRMKPEEIKALSVGSDPDGGYTVPPETSSRITKIIFETSPLRSLATVETIGADEMKFLEDTDEASVGWVGETTTRPETDTPQLGEKTIVAHELYAKPKATQKLIEDSVFNIESWLTNKVSEKFARTEATAFISGNGVGKPRGITTYASGTSWGQIQQVNSGSAGAFTYEGLIDLINSLKEPYHANASFLTKRESVAPILKLKDGDNRYIFMPVGPEGFNNAPLLGYPLRFATDMAAVASAALAMAFGDFRRGYLIVDRLGYSLLRDPYSSKPYVEFYIRRRVGGDVVNYEAIKLHKLSS